MYIRAHFSAGRLAGVVLTVASVIGVAAPASATTINFAASTTGCFAHSSLTCVPTATATLDELTFTGEANTTGQIDYPSQDTINPFALGTFSINHTSGSNANITPGSDNYFDLLVSFTLPSLNQNTYEAALVGQITGGNNDTFTIDFSQLPFTFNFTDANGSGSFQLTVLNDPTFTWIGSQTDGHYDQSSVDLNGKIELIRYDTVNQGTDNLNVVPEPATLLMVGTGIVGLVRARHRRRM
jgi:hypothetical protein